MPAPPPMDPKVAAVPRFGPTGPTATPVVKLQGLGTTPAASGLPARSVAAFEIVAVYCVLGVRLAAGGNVAMSFTAAEGTVPVTAAPPTPATATANVPGAVMVSGSISLLKVALTTVLRETLIAPLAGLVRGRVGGVVSVPAPVVKFQGLGTAPAARALPLRSNAAFVMVAV